MEELRTFLESHRTSDKQLTKFISLAGGKYDISLEDKDLFYSLYGKAAPFFTEKSYIPLVYKVPNISLQPLMIDIDLRTIENPLIDSIAHAKFCQCLAIELARLTNASDISYFIVTKDNPYKKKYNDKICFASGCHIYFMLVRIPLSLAKHMLDYGVSRCLEYYNQYNPINEPSEIVDSRIPKRSNGLCLIASFKGPESGGQYQIRIIGKTFADGRVEEQFVQKDEFFENLPQNIEKLGLTIRKFFPRL